MNDTKQMIDELKRIRDEVRVKMHLGEMEVKEWWTRVEPQLIELETTLAQGAGKATESATIVIDEFVKAFHRIHDRVGDSEKG